MNMLTEVESHVLLLLPEGKQGPMNKRTGLQVDKDSIFQQEEDVASVHPPHSIRKLLPIGLCGAELSHQTPG